MLLAIIGGQMLRESFAHRKEPQQAGTREALSWKMLFAMAVATSIDALAVGITFAFLQVDIGPAAALIGCTTFIISLAGVWIGNRFGSRYQSKATFAGGLILCLIGLKILLEHLGLLP